MALNIELAKLYHNTSDSGSFGGVDRLHKSAKEHGLNATRDDVTKFLSSVDTYTLHKPSRKRYKRNMIVVGSIDQQWQADLADMSQLARYNDGHKYLLTVIDCFSKYAWIIPVKKKDAKALVAAFKTLLDNKEKRKPQRLHTDKGKEFMNKQVKELLTEHNIHLFASESDMKAAMVERFNRTIKQRIFAYLTYKNTSRYIDVLQDLVTSYNKSTHRTIGMRPCDVTSELVPKIFSKVYGNYLASKHNVKPNTLTTVRVSDKKTVFDKSYLPHWSTELFNVNNIVHAPREVYKLKDMAGEEIGGVFYPEEVQFVKHSDKHKVDKILRTRKVADKKEYFVHWLGLPNKFNSWISETDYNDRS